MSRKHGIHRRGKQGGIAPTPKKDGFMSTFYAQHRIDHPNCTYGNEPHFIPPSFGEVGFYMCDPPADLRNHTRCHLPYDHEHPDHFPFVPFINIK